MRLRRHIELAMTLAAIAAALPAAAEMYKWVDDRGTTHYSDRKPEDPKDAGKVKPVSGNVSVYSPDKPLLAAVESARQRRAQPEYRIEPERAPPPYAYPAAAQLPADSCEYADCGPLYYPYAPALFAPFRRRPPHFVQGRLPPGAVAGGNGGPRRTPPAFRASFDTQFSRR